jgi:aryl-alcohol dehydrogenase-like predicted oxidoreductase
MEYRQLGKSEVEVSVIAFGAWAIGGWMWGGADRSDALKALQTAIANGMTTIDTAPAYGFGLSEELVGEAIRGKRDRVQILTKYGLRWDVQKGQFFFPTRDNNGKPIDMYRYAAKESVMEECENSLRRLKTDYIDLYQIHWPDPTTPIAETMEAVDTLIRQGKIRAAGVCNYQVDQLKEASGSVSIASNQVPYSMVRRDIEKDLVPWCLSTQTAIIAYSPLQRGLLTGKIGPGYTFGEGDTRPDSPYYKEPNLSRILQFLEKLKPLAEKRAITLAQLVLNWTVQQPGITCVLAGARNEKQVLENLGAARFMLTEEEIKYINQELNHLILEL